jgi:hypothetical protein
MLYSSQKNCERNGHYAKYSKEHLKNGSMKKRIQTLRRSSINDGIVTGQGVCVSSPVLKSHRSLLKSWVTRIAKQQMVGCLDRNLGMT